MIRPDGAASDAILTTLTPADRIPSIGTQLPVFAAEPAGPYWPCCPRHARTGLDHRDCPTGSAGTRDHGSSYGPSKPERLTLWDQPAELWSE